MTDTDTPAQIGATRQFRKKPVVIEAWQFPGSITGAPAWLRGALENGSVRYEDTPRRYLTIETLEGDHRANLDDWIIRGVKGELYPCKPDIFAATYEPADKPALSAPRIREEALREALHWYADQVAGCRKISSDGDVARNALAADGGERARQALALIDAPQGGEDGWQPIDTIPTAVGTRVQALCEVELYMEENVPAALMGGWKRTAHHDRIIGWRQPPALRSTQQEAGRG